ncbi:MAG: thiamine phosphate synthase [Akkermansiaceae bacterium]|nr:thiamine phosphate synthase [Akkermansiaceae bacterium]
MNAGREQLAAARLYGILDLGYVAEGDLEAAARALLAGGVDLLQLRAKGLGEDEVLSMAGRLRPLCRVAGVPLIVNDFPRVAAEAGAAGVHLGQDDGSLRDARRLLGADALVGRSTHSPAQAAAAREEGFDYIGFGPLFPTPTKAGRPGIGLGDVGGVQGGPGADLPVFCIGGIHPGNLEAVLAAGARRIVMVSALLQADDIAAATRTVKNRLDEL